MDITFSASPSKPYILITTSSSFPPHHLSYPTPPSNAYTQRKHSSYPTHHSTSISPATPSPSKPVHSPCSTYHYTLRWIITPSEDQNHKTQHAERSDSACFARHVTRCLGLLEDLRAENIGYGEENEGQGIKGYFLGMACCITISSN